MSSGAAVRPEVTGDTRLARARERFLSAEPIEPGQVRDTILARGREEVFHLAATSEPMTLSAETDLLAGVSVEV